MDKLTKHVRRLLLLGLLLAGVLMTASVAVALEVGESAPDFALYSTTGERSA